MADKILSIVLCVIFVCFIPVFISILINGNTPGEDVEHSEISTQKVMVNYKDNIIQLDLESYIIGVVSAEMPASYEMEALKAQAICARTYTLKQVENNSEIIFTDQLQSYVDETELRQRWSESDFTNNMMRIEQAVAATKGVIITYDDKTISAVFHAISPGETRSAKKVWGQEVPYLVGCDSHWDENSKNYYNNYRFTSQEFLGVVGIEADSADDQVISNIVIDEKGYTESLTIGETVVKGDWLRERLQLASSSFTVEEKEGLVLIKAKGYGHGVGLSQYGANEMAKEGSDYSEIIHHYYETVKLKKIQ